MFRGTLFDGSLSLVNVLGLLGVIAAFRKREPGGLLWALHGLLLIAFVGVEVQLSLGLLDLEPFGSIDLYRLTSRKIDRKHRSPPYGAFTALIAPHPARRHPTPLVRRLHMCKAGAA